MNKEISKIILEHFLSRSSHHHLNRINRIAYTTQLPASYCLPQQKFLEGSLSSIFCDFLLTKDHTQSNIKPSSFLNQTAIMSNPYLVKPSIEEKEENKIKSKLITIIKKLHSPSDFEKSYDQIEELVLSINHEEAYECRKYLIYMNKWILNLKGKMGESEVKAEELRKIVIRRICDGLCQNEEHIEIKVETETDLLAKAKESILKGDHKEAKASYEGIFLNLENSDSARMEALEYLCRNGQERGDTTYLLSIITRIEEENGSQQHLNCVRKALKKLSHRTTR